MVKANVKRFVKKNVEKLKCSVILKFNNVEMLKTLWKMLKTPAAGICSLCQNFSTKNLDKANRKT